VYREKKKTHIPTALQAKEVQKRLSGPTADVFQSFKRVIWDVSSGNMYINPLKTKRICFI
jgi:hypothetical protein